MSRDGDPRRVLLVRRRAFGDFLLTLPAMAALRERFPHAELDLAVDPPLVEAARAWAPVDRVLLFPDRASAAGALRWASVLRFALAARHRGYDLVVDFHSTPQTAAVSWFTGAAARVGLDRAGRRWAYTRRVPRAIEREAGGRTRYMAEAFLDFARAAGAAAAPAPEAGFLSSAARGARPPRGARRLALAPGATWGAKAWPAASYAELARCAMREVEARVTVYWGPGEEPQAEAIVTAAPGAERAPGGSLLELARALSGESLLVSGDSGARHLAIALGVPTVGLFGPTDPWGSTPPAGDHPWLRHAIACAPCQRHTCPLAENYCLTRVSAPEVWQVVRPRLEGA